MQFNIQASCSLTDSDSDSVALINMPNIIMEKWKEKKDGLSEQEHNRLYYKGPSLGDTWLIDSTVQSFTGDLTQLTAKAAGMPSQSVSFYTRPMGMDQKRIFRAMEKMKVSCQRVLLKIGWIINERFECLY